MSDFSVFDSFCAKVSQPKKLRLREFVMESKKQSKLCEEEMLKNPIEINSEVVKINENNCVIANGTKKLIGFEKKEHVSVHVDTHNDSVNSNSQTVKIQSESKEINDEQAKILSANKILVESSKGK